MEVSSKCCETADKQLKKTKYHTALSSTSKKNRIRSLNCKFVYLSTLESVQS